MSDKTWEKAKVQLILLNSIITEYSPLLILIKNREPDIIESSAMATVMHSFYNGVENIFKIIIKGNNEKLPNSKEWHIELLEIVIKPAERRKPIISKQLQ